MSKDRDSGDSASYSGPKFRNQSPSTTHRRSRDRDHRTDKQHHHTPSPEMTADHNEAFNESRISGEFYSFN